MTSPVYSPPRPRIVPKVKAANETIQSTDTPQNDDDLFFPIGANEVWAFNFFLVIESGSTSDFRFGIAGPTGAEAWWNEPTGGIQALDISTTKVLNCVDGVTMFVMASGVVFNGGTVGNFQVRWSQDISTASDTTVLEHSYLIATRLT